ncbi:MAG TPA: acyltransferase family protein [Azonexus sp.]|nr:acyltransferase family protein [Azonexus sp.]
MDKDFLKDGMTTQQISADFGNHRVVGLDTLRLVALILVTWQHAASVLGAYAATQWRGISPGQTGVAIFCAISGYLAFHTTPWSALEWLMRRLRSIFPSYWMVTIAAFAMAIVLGSSKPVTIGLFVVELHVKLTRDLH